METSDCVEFEMPLQMQGKLAGDPQFDGMTRRYRISRAAIEKSLGEATINVSTQALYDEYFFDVWMTIEDEAWRKRPVDGIVHLGPDDIKG
ncbi:hypothetical protein [Sphingobium indicum]|uniref:Uncharacterized protein n=1 Tax=Sphingobium indicum (strain DSM 16412 / CCM 7286 / MTCC 6364 / B90A) TaxID=861109 RepID=A0A1L5BME3_SPHIB|nr:hypothetical protein [Sphingobium indicum]APL94120.1 hypothetical protein SIDU_06140 [Sphingobium indicum B90A]